MDNKKIKEFVKLAQKMEDIKLAYESARQELVEDMRNAKLEKAETELGTFTRAVKTNYKYTDKVKALKEKVKVQEIKEQNSGAATITQTEYLRYTPVKK